MIVPRGEEGVYVGTAHPFNQSGYLIYVPAKQQFVVASHVTFDEEYYPARKFNKRVKDLNHFSPANIDPAFMDAALRDPHPRHVHPPSPVSDADHRDDPDDDPTCPPLCSSDSEDSDDAVSDTEDADEPTPPPPTPAAIPSLALDEHDLSPRRNVTRLQARARADLYDHGIAVINNSRPSWLQDIPTSPSIEPLTLVDPIIPQSPDPSTASPVIDAPSHDADLEAQQLMDEILALDLPEPTPPTRQEHEHAFKAIGEAIAQEYTRARGAAVRQSVARKQVLCLKSITVDASLKRTADAQSGTYVPNTGYLGIGKDDFLPNGDLDNKYLARVLIKAFKAHAKEHPDQRASAVAEIKLLRNPKTMAEALSTPERQRWIEAINKEMKSLIDKDTYEVKKLLPGRKPIPTRLVLTIKLQSDGSIDKFKARCVVAGFMQRSGIDYNPDGTYSPMTEAVTVRLLLSIASRLKLRIDHLDIKTAFLNGVLPAHERFWCSPPAGFAEAPGYGWHMKKGLYGAHQSGAVWAETWRKWIKEEAPQFKEAGNERCVYVFRENDTGTPIDLDKLRGVTLEPGEKLVILVMNTDDLLILYTDNALSLVDTLEQKICTSFEATPRAPVDQYLGLHITRDADGNYLSIDARKHVYNFIWHMGQDPHSGVTVKTPLDPHITYSKADCPETVDTALRAKVWQAHGKLIHLAVWARPDLAHAVSVLGRYVHNPSAKLWDAYQRVCKYLIRTKDLRLVYGTPDREGLQGILYGGSDSDWGGCLDDRRSTGSYLFFFNGAGVSWKVKLSQTACLSTQEAEYIALSEATKEALNIRMLLEQLGFGSPDPTILFCDNQGAITMSLHPSNKPATRHVDCRIHMCRQHVELGHVKSKFKRTGDLTMDMLTKQTPAPTHEKHTATVFGYQIAPLPLFDIQRLVL